MPSIPGEALARLVVGDSGDDDHVVAPLPVHRRRHLVGGRELQRVDHPQDLVEVAAGALRVGDRQLHLLVRADHEDRTHGRRVARVGMDHPVEVGDDAVGIGDQREVGRCALGLRDVARPAPMGIEGVDAEADHLHTARIELGLDPGQLTELGRAHRSEVLGVREQDAPAVADPVVEPNVPSVVSAVKSGASSPSCSAVVPALFVFVMFLISSSGA